MFLYKDLDLAAFEAVKVAAEAELGKLMMIQEKLQGIEKHL